MHQLASLPHRRRRSRWPLAIGLALALACSANDRAADGTSAATTASGGVVDSALPIETLLQRFRATIADTPSVLAGGESSPELLTRALLTAVSGRDTAAVRRLVMSRAEFAWLYYPHTKFTAPPYELGPDLVWLQHRAASEQGVTRLFDRYGGARLRLERLHCADSVQREGPNRIVTDCRVRFAVGDSAARELQLFAALLNRDGRYKFLSYANDL